MRTLLQIQFILCTLSDGIITSRHYLSETNIVGTKNVREKGGRDSTKVEREPVETKVDREQVETKVDRELVNTMLVKCNLKLAERLAEWLAEWLAEYHDDEERELVKHNTMLVKCNFKLAGNHNDDEEEKKLVERNARVAKCNLKLAERLIQWILSFL